MGKNCRAARGQHANVQGSGFRFLELRVQGLEITLYKLLNDVRPSGWVGICLFLDYAV